MQVVETNSTEGMHILHSGASGIIKCYTLLFLAVGTTSSARSSSAEAEALKLALEYLVNSMDTTSLLPAALSRRLIREQQKAECASEPNLYQKTEKFLEHLQREVNGDSKKFHTFVQLLVDTGHSNLASRLSG